VSRPPRLAVFSPIYGLNGPVTGLRWWFLARYLSAAGAEVTVFHQTTDPGAARGLTIAGGAAPREVFVPPGRRALARLSGSLNRLVMDTWRARPGRLRGLVQFGTESLSLLSQSGRGTRAAFEHVFRDGPRPDVLIGAFIGWSGVSAALALNRRGLPLLLEFRDPWRQYHPFTWPYHQPRIHRCVRRALATINVTPPWCARDREEFGKESLFLPHGYPPEILDLPAAPPAGPLAVGYFGSMLYPQFNYRDWFAGLAALEPGTACFHYVGGHHEGVRALSTEVGIADRVRAGSRIDIWDVFPRQRALDVLLTFSWNDLSDQGHFGFKLAEMLAARRPVLVVGPRDEALYEALAACTRVVWVQSPEEVAAALRALAEEKRRTGSVKAETNDAVIREQAWDRVAERLLAELRRLVPTLR
jgi:glycosyltransferase involved in cell wall biosynthesis